MGREIGCRRTLGIGAVLAMLAGAGCDDGRALGRDDVTGLPPGDAVGTTFSGSYLLTSAALTSCHCRAGRCSDITITPQSAPTTIVQQDGLLTMTDAAGVTSTGGVDADGTFSVGSAQEQPGIAIYSRTDGTFVLANGQPDSATFTATSTDIITMTGLHFDCDITAAGTLSFQGP